MQERRRCKCQYSVAMKQWLTEAQVCFEIVSILARLSFLCSYSRGSIQSRATSCKPSLRGSAVVFFIFYEKPRFWKYKTHFTIKYQTRHIAIPSLGTHVTAQVPVPGEEDATFARIAHTEESTARIKQPCRGFTGRIGVDCFAPEHLSTFHPCRF